MTSYIIETRELTKKYKNQTIVNQLNMKVPQGQIYGFLGPNGAGKTTTIRMLLGLIRPTNGEVKIFNQGLKRNRTSILSKVGSLVETPTYYGHLTGYENLEVTRRLLQIENNKRIDEVLQFVRLNKVKDKKVRDYSLGMKQRLGIATALLNDPQLLILDEPTNGLDPAGIQEIREFIKELPKKYGMTILVSSHLLSEIELIATQVGIIHKGKMLFQDSVNVLRAKSEPKIRIKVNNPIRAVECLEEEGIKASFQGEQGVLYVREANPQLAGEINKLLVENGFVVSRLEGVKKSLEDIFLDLIGKERSL